MEEYEKLAYRMHGIIATSSDSDSGPEELDAIYYLLKPPPLDYESIKDKIVEIRAVRAIEEHTEYNNANMQVQEKSETAKVKKKRKKKSIIRDENYLNINATNLVATCHSQMTDTNITAAKNKCGTSIPNNEVKKSKRGSKISLCTLEKENPKKNPTISVSLGKKKTILKSSSGAIPNQASTSCSSRKENKIRNLLHLNAKELNKIQTNLEKLNQYVNMQMQENGEKAEVKKKRKKKSKAIIRDENYLNINDKSPVGTCQLQMTDTNIIAAKNKCSTTIENGKAKKNKKGSNIPLCSLENKSSNKNSTINITLDKGKTILKSSGKVIANQPSSSCSSGGEKRFRNIVHLEAKDLNKIQTNLEKLKKPNAELDAETIRKETKLRLRREKDMYEEWCKQNKSLNNHKKIQQSNSIENNTVQTNDFGIGMKKKNRSRKKTKMKEICTNNLENVQGDVKTNIVVSNKKNSKEMVQVSDAKPNMKTTPVVAKVSNSHNVKKNKVPDSDRKYNINPLTCPQGILGDGFHDFMQNVLSERYNIHGPSLINYCDEISKQQVITDKKKKTNSGLENNADGKVITKKQRKLKENRDGENKDLHCLKNLNSDLQSDYEFVGQNFQRFMNSSSDMSLDEYVEVTEGTSKKKKPTPVHQIVINGTKNYHKGEKYDIVQVENSNINVNHLNNDNNVTRNTFDEDLKQCYYYDYTGQNFQSYMEFREIYLYMSPGNIPESKQSTKGKNVATIFTKCDTTENDLDKVNNNFQDSERHNIHRPFLTNSSDEISKQVITNKKKNKKKKTNSGIESNADNKVITKKQRKLKENRDRENKDLHCLKNLNSDLKSDCQFVGQNFQHFLNSSSDMSLDESVEVTEGTSEKKKPIPVHQTVIDGTKNYHKEEKCDIVQVENSNINVNHLNNNNNVTRNTFDEDLKQCYYYDYTGQNFQSYMEFREIYLYMSPGNIPESKQSTKGKNVATIFTKCDTTENDLDKVNNNFQDSERHNIHRPFLTNSSDEISKQVITNKKKNKKKKTNSGIESNADNKVITKKQRKLKENRDRENKDLHCLKNLNSDLKSDCQFVGQNFQHFMNSSSDMSLDESVEVTEGTSEKKKPIPVHQTVIDGTKNYHKEEKCDIVQVENSNINVNHLNNNNNVTRNTFGKDSKQCYYYDYTGQNFQSYMEFREMYLYMSLGNIPESKQSTKKENKEEKSKGKNIATVVTKCDIRENDLDKVNNGFQDNILPKKYTNVSNYELFLKLIHVLFILLVAYIIKVVIFEYYFALFSFIALFLFFLLVSVRFKRH